MKTEIRFESSELTIVRFRRSQTVKAFCEICREKALHLTTARASAALRISETGVFRLVENGAAHSTETPAGILLVCVNSLSALAKEIQNEKK